MTAPVRPTRRVVDRARAKAAGYTDAEIDAYERGQEVAAFDTAPPRPTGTVPAESTAAVRRGVADTGGDVGALNPVALARQAIGQGALMGAGDELEAGVRTLGGFAGDYRQTRDDIRTANARYAEAHPAAALTANLAGGLATGFGGAATAARVPAMARTLARVGLAPTAGQTGVSRALLAARAGGTAGALAGAGSAEEMRDVPRAMTLGGVGGAVAGGMLSGFTDLLRGAVNVASGIGQRAPVAGQSVDATAGRVRRALRTATGNDTERGAAQRVLATMERDGVTVDDLADPEGAQAVAERIGPAGVRALRIARNAGRESDVIDRALTDRAAEEPANWSRVIGRESGVMDPRDPTAFRKEVVGRARQIAAPRYAQAQAQPDVAVPDVAEAVSELGQMRIGKPALERARDLAVGKGTAIGAGDPTDVVSVANLQNLREGIDWAIRVLEAQGDEQGVGLLQQRRVTVDQALKAAGGPDQVAADQVMAEAYGMAESFQLGQRSQSARTAEEIERLAREARDPEAFRMGAASEIQARLGQVADGAAGQVRNPVSGAMASRTARARTRAALPDDAAMDRVTDEADKIVERLRTRQAVSGNSATARNHAEMADEFMADPAAMAQAVVDPMSLPRRILAGTVAASARGLNVDQATAMGRMLSAGLPGQQMPAEVQELLRRLIPLLEASERRRVMLQTGGVTGLGAGLSGRR